MIDPGGALVKAVPMREPGAASGQGGGRSSGGSYLRAKGRQDSKMASSAAPILSDSAAPGCMVRRAAA